MGKNLGIGGPNRTQRRIAAAGTEGPSLPGERQGRGSAAPERRETVVGGTGNPNSPSPTARGALPTRREPGGRRAASGGAPGAGRGADRDRRNSRRNGTPERRAGRGW